MHTSCFLKRLRFNNVTTVFVVRKHFKSAAMFALGGSLQRSHQLFKWEIEVGGSAPQMIFLSETHNQDQTSEAFSVTYSNKNNVNSEKHDSGLSYCCLFLLYRGASVIRNSLSVLLMFHTGR